MWYARMGRGLSRAAQVRDNVGQWTVVCLTVLTQCSDATDGEIAAWTLFQQLRSNLVSQHPRVSRHMETEPLAHVNACHDTWGSSGGVSTQVRSQYIGSNGGGSTRFRARIVIRRDCVCILGAAWVGAAQICK